MQDILPEDVPLWKKVESAMHRICALYRYSEIRTPLFEFTSLFTRSVGEVTDIVEKEMYTFTSNTDSTPISLRPEFTAGIVRAYLQHSMHKQKAFQKFYAFGPLFRRERPQKGRYRQFHQFDIEALGSYSPYLDAETILLASDFLNELGLKEYKISINSIGCPACRAKYREALQNALAPRIGELCQNCQARYERNVFRIMDCKSEKCRAIAAGLPPIQQKGILCDECRDHFGKVFSILKATELEDRVNTFYAGQTTKAPKAKSIPNPLLVRGFDYYTKTTFEFTYSSALGSQDAILGGGRYDNLIEELGGPKSGAVGFAAGIERIILALKDTKTQLSFKKLPKKIPIFIASVTEQEQKRNQEQDTILRDAVFKITTQLRRDGRPADMDFENRSLKAQMKIANKLNYKYVITIGSDELKHDTVKIKNMNTGDEKTCPRKYMLEYLNGYDIVNLAHSESKEIQRLNEFLDLYNKAISLHQSGNENGAADSLNEAEKILIELKIDDAFLLSELYGFKGTVERNIEKNEEAENDLIESVKKNNEYALIWFVLCTVQKKLGKEDEAIKSFMKAYEITGDAWSDWAQREGNKKYFPSEFLERLKSEVEKQYVYDASGTQNVKNSMNK
ncbi:MAG: histidine--tRNA ligase [Planctomycetes bacterium]|nr:histidine--tRNA ligase [Planctomycetota bacterium]